MWLALLLLAAWFSPAAATAVFGDRLAAVPAATPSRVPEEDATPSDVPGR